MALPVTRCAVSRGKKGKTWSGVQTGLLLGAGAVTYGDVWEEIPPARLQEVLQVRERSSEPGESGGV